MQEGEEEDEYEEINDEVYLKFHNFFEQKEKEYQKKVSESFKKKSNKANLEIKNENNEQNKINENLNTKMKNKESSNLIKINLQD